MCKRLKKEEVEVVKKLECGSIIKKDGKYGFCFDDSIEIVAVNCKNIEVLDLPFDEKTEGIIKFEKKGKCSLLDKDGKVLFEHDCDELKFKNGKLIAITY